MSQKGFENLILLTAGVALTCGLYLIKEAREDYSVKQSVTTWKSTVQRILKSSKEDNSPVRVVSSSQTQKLQRRPANTKSRGFNGLRKHLFALESCYLNPGKCGMPQTDPKAEFFAIGKKIRADLNQLFQMAMTQKIKNEEMAGLARHFLKVPDGHVKEAALHLLSTQDKDPMSMESILKDIINYHDARLIEHAMLELQYYLNDPDQAHRIHSALSNAIQRGSIMVSQEITRHIRPFIDSRSLSLYSKTVKGLAIGGISRKRIENAIKDFKLAQKAA